MTVVQFCDWCACVGCSAGNCCDHGKFLEDGRFNPKQPHRLPVRVISGQQNAFGGEFVVEDQFGNMYKWIINCVEEPRYRGVPELLANRLSERIDLDSYDIYPEKRELNRIFGEGLL